ncbi:MAG TPA: isochorismatase family protein [Solirubrobacteraceae bacterium]|nr:isochorismatase family protein [Solirubrobacteraceae bacterium]
MSDAGEVYGERGFGGRQGAGRRPALVVIDLNYGFTDPESPLHCDTDAAVAATARLLEAARAGGAPVAFTTLEYDEGAKRVARAFLAKAPALAMLTPGSRWSQIDERIAPRADEPVLLKLFASAFFGTALQPMLTAAGCDTLVVAGASTSGCVRATVVDALQHGLSVVVPRDAVADRAASAHEASLTDIDAKYGDVVSLEEAIAVLSAREIRDADPATK